MAFCSNCGTQLGDGVKFCPSCGTPAGGAAPAPRPATEKAGNIIKCPGCGEVIPSMTAVCPTCGHEFRNMETGGKIKEFFDKVLYLETEFGRLQAADDDQQYARWDELESYVTGYPVPNTKEDIIEFALFCSARMNANDNDFANKYNREYHHDIWTDKCIQTYQRAAITMGSDKETLAQIVNILREKNLLVNKKEKEAGKKSFFSRLREGTL